MNKINEQNNLETFTLKQQDFISIETKRSLKYINELYFNKDQQFKKICGETRDGVFIINNRNQL